MNIILAIFKYRKQVSAIVDAFLKPVYDALQDGKLDQAEKDRLCAVMWAIMDPYLEEHARKVDEEARRENP